MIKIIGIAGSLRKQSYNTALLHAAAQLLPEHAALEIATIRDIPLYNEDMETTEGGQSVAGTHCRIGRAAVGHAGI